MATLDLARKARSANKKLLEDAHLTYTAMVRRGGKETPAVIAYFATRAQAAGLPKELHVGEKTVPLVIRIGHPLKPE
ncbi:MAG: hypothetical protein ACREXY_01965 [Gammaproteobacteria bacterium]